MPGNNNQSQISCFDPIVDMHTKILILGTLPGPESLATNQYYASSRNSFWKIIYALFGQTTPPADYREKCAFLLQHQIGVWDVLGSASREGFADANIENPVPNNFVEFLKEHPQICGIVFNGKSADDKFRCAFPALYVAVKHELVLSSSGSLGRKHTDKLDNWEMAVEKLTK